MKKIFTLCLLSFFLTACSNDSERYQYSDDHAPTNIPPLEHIEDVNPRYEPHSRGGNKDYTVRGIDYEVWKNKTELTEKGGASWYGNKFHGHLTSNGERYNMYAMSAAHKNLPLPSYVEVTNVANNKKIIVRVNDRGPFHEGRIIDLSYAAAKKLDMLDAGTAQVEVKLLHFAEDENAALLNDMQQKSINGEFNIQYLVTSSEERAKQLSDELATRHNVAAYIDKKKQLHHLRLGPITSEAQAERILSSIQTDFPQAYIIHKTE